MNAVADFSKTQFSSFAPGKSSLTTAERIARGLGWFSIGLGVVELVAPGKLARAFGLEGKEGLLRAYGAREIGAGVGALSVDAPVGVWSRVPGDMLDLATLAMGLKGDDRQRKNAIGAIAAVIGITALDIATAMTLTSERKRDETTRDYRSRSGFPKGANASRGLAQDFSTPRELKAELPSVA